MPKHTARPVDSGRKRKKASRPIAGTCPVTGKLQFASKAKAKKELCRYQGEQAARAVYQCPHHDCRKWHLTKQRPHERGAEGVASSR